MGDSGRTVLEVRNLDLLKQKPSWRQKHINGAKIAMVFQDPMTSFRISWASW